MEKVERWTGAFQFREYLDRAGGVPEVDLPPEVPGVYFITGRRWSGPLCDMAESLYVGKAYAAASGGLRGRLGDFVSSLLGFHGPLKTSGGRHNGGITVNLLCRNAARNPLELFLAWFPMPEASEQQVLDKERKLIDKLNPICNRTGERRKSGRTKSDG